MRETPNKFDEIIERISTNERPSRPATINPIVASVIGHALGIDEQVVQSVSKFADHEVREKPFRSILLATGAGVLTGAVLAFRMRNRGFRRSRYL